MPGIPRHSRGVSSGKRVAEPVAANAKVETLAQMRAEVQSGKLTDRPGQRYQHYVVLMSCTDNCPYASPMTMAYFEPIFHTLPRTLAAIGFAHAVVGSPPPLVAAFVAATTPERLKALDDAQNRAKCATGRQASRGRQANRVDFKPYVARAAERTVHASYEVAARRTPAHIVRTLDFVTCPPESGFTNRPYQQAAAAEAVESTLHPCPHGGPTFSIPTPACRIAFDLCLSALFAMDHPTPNNAMSVFFSRLDPGLGKTLIAALAMRGVRELVHRAFASAVAAPGVFHAAPDNTPIRGSDGTLLAVDGDGRCVVYTPVAPYVCANYDNETLASSGVFVPATSAGTDLCVPGPAARTLPLSGAFVPEGGVGRTAADFIAGTAGQFAEFGRACGVLRYPCYLVVVPAAVVEQWRQTLTVILGADALHLWTTVSRKLAPEKLAGKVIIITPQSLSSTLRAAAKPWAVPIAPGTICGGAIVLNDGIDHPRIPAPPSTWTPVMAAPDGLAPGVIVVHMPGKSLFTPGTGSVLFGHKLYLVCEVVVAPRWHGSSAHQGSLRFLAKVREVGVDGVSSPTRAPEVTIDARELMTVRLCKAPLKSAMMTSASCVVCACHAGHTTHDDAGNGHYASNVRDEASGGPMQPMHSASDMRLGASPLRGLLPVYVIVDEATPTSKVHKFLHELQARSAMLVSATLPLHGNELNNMVGVYTGLAHQGRGRRKTVVADGIRQATEAVLTHRMFYLRAPQLDAPTGSPPLSLAGAMTHAPTMRHFRVRVTRPPAEEALMGELVSLAMAAANVRDPVSFRVFMKYVRRAPALLDSGAANGLVAEAKREADGAVLFAARQFARATEHRGTDRENPYLPLLTPASRKRFLTPDVEDFDLAVTAEAAYGDGQCLVCLEPVVLGVVTPCSHVFCGGCLAIWLVHKSTCPACRAEIPDRRAIKRLAANGDNDGGGGAAAGGAAAGGAAAGGAAAGGAAAGGAAAGGAAAGGAAAGGAVPNVTTPSVSRASAVARVLIDLFRFDETVSDPFAAAAALDEALGRAAAFVCGSDRKLASLRSSSLAAKMADPSLVPVRTAPPVRIESEVPRMMPPTVEVDGKAPGAAAPRVVDCETDRDDGGDDGGDDDDDYLPPSKAHRSKATSSKKRSRGAAPLVRKKRVKAKAKAKNKAHVSAPINIDAPLSASVRARRVRAIVFFTHYSTRVMLEAVMAHLGISFVVLETGMGAKNRNNALASDHDVLLTRPIKGLNAVGYSVEIFADPVESDEMRRQAQDRVNRLVSFQREVWVIWVTTHVTEERMNAPVKTMEELSVYEHAFSDNAVSRRIHGITADTEECTRAYDPDNPLHRKLLPTPFFVGAPGKSKSDIARMLRSMLLLNPHALDGLRLEDK